MKAKVKTYFTKNQWVEVTHFPEISSGGPPKVTRKEYYLVTFGTGFEASFTPEQFKVLFEEV